MPELKPCPFCGGEAKISVREATYGESGARVVCKKCRAKTRYYSTHEMIVDAKTLYTPVTEEGKRRGINEATEAWNKRTGGSE